MSDKATAHYEGDPLAGAPLAHEFTHCEIGYKVFRTADGKRVRVMLASLRPEDGGHWALDAEVEPAGYLRIRRAPNHDPFSVEFLLGLVGRVQAELYDGVSGAVYTVSGPNG